MSDNCDSSPTVSQSPAPGTVFSGTTSVTLTVTDTSGNDASTSFDVSVEDIAAPVIICPENIIVTADEVGIYVLQDLTADAIVTDNCTLNPTVVQIPVAGTILPDGSINTITLIAIDEGGNISECNFIIEVEENLSFTDTVLRGNDIILHPSPANNFFRIHNKGNSILQKLEIYDIRGRSISMFNLNDDGNNSYFNVSRLASGVYWVTIIAEEGKIIKRLLLDNK